jgi:hypothetical protein
VEEVAYSRDCQVGGPLEAEAYLEEALVGEVAFLAVAFLVEVERVDTAAEDSAYSLAGLDSPQEMEAAPFAHLGGASA